MSTLLPSLFSDTAIFFGLSLGLWISFRILTYPDLSVEFLFVLGGVAYAFGASTNGGTVMLSVGIALAAIILGGLCSVIRNCFRVHPVLISLAAAYLYYSLSLALLGGPAMYVGDRSAPPSDLKAGLVAIAVFAGVLGLLAYAQRTSIGLRVIAAGSNSELAARHALFPMFWQGLGLSVSFALVMISGALYAWRAGNADVSYGSGLLLVSIFVVVATRAVSVRVNMVRNGVVLALFLFAYLALLQITLYLGLPPQWLRGVSAVCLLALVLAIPRGKGRTLAI